MTIKEIAEQLNISISTVSKALNGATDVSEDRKKYICEYAKSVGYHKKQSSQKLGRIAVLFEHGDVDNKNSVLSYISNAFSELAIANRYEVIAANIPTPPTEFHLEEYLTENRFSAAFLIGLTFRSPTYHQLNSTSIPLVLFDNHIPDNPLIASVASENIGATETLVSYLVSHGHKKIGLLTGEKEAFVSAERFAGYILGHARMGLEHDQANVYFGHFTRTAGEQAAGFFKEKGVTAVICASDLIAMGLINGLRDLGVRVPQDISVTGFDDLDLLKFTSYDLTTMKQDFHAIGEKAFRLLLEMLRGKPAQRCVIECKLIERNSVATIQ
ncbi:MAG: LacI family DNA-binding transcriptional regulator [Christensenellaceae bacterium]